MALYDVYFRLVEAACLVVEATDESNAREVAERELANMSKKDILDRLYYALDFWGVKVDHVERVD